MIRPYRLAAISLALLCALPSLAKNRSHDTHARKPKAAVTNNVKGDVILEARDAFSRKDLAALASARIQANSERHELASWVEYWDLNARLSQATAAEVEAFYARWKGTYVEDRLRNDRLLVLGRQRDWQTFSADFPRFRMNDDREVTCYAQVADLMAGREVQREAAAEAWLAQRELDDGCKTMSSQLYERGILRDEDVWNKIRLSVEAGRPKVARAAAELLGDQVARTVEDAASQPVRYLSNKDPSPDVNGTRVAAVAIARLAASDVDAAAKWAQEWQRQMQPAIAGWTWGQVAMQGGLKLHPQASEWYLRANALASSAHTPIPWSQDMLAWEVRSALRGSPQRWSLVRDAIDSMPAARQSEPVWVYWKARSLAALAVPGVDGNFLRTQARQMMESIAGGVNFYGKLAAEDLGRPQQLPPSPSPLTQAEKVSARANDGLTRAVRLIKSGLRNEGVREWNYTLRDMDDRSLLAAADLACQHEIWDRCINTSEKTRDQINMAQRFPMPHKQAVLTQARSVGVDPAYVYGLIRQESRFITDARSHVGASGLMQVMPATAQWTAKKLGIPFKPAMITDRDTNLKIGAGYLKLVLDGFEGSEAMAAAAYNAGPGRPRRWREGPVLEAAIWAENIPFNETRDYVQKVLSNAADYSALINGSHIALKPRLGDRIGPREAASGGVEQMP